MKSGGRSSIAVLLVLVILAGTSVLAECATCPSPAGSAMPCCGAGGALSLLAVSCCRTQAAAPSALPSQGVTPPAAPAVLAASAAPSRRPVPVAHTAGLPPAPPPLHQGIGLYKLHSVFLI